MEGSAPGMYENDSDREGLRQMLNSLRRDPMEVEDDPDNNDGSFFPCEFCGDPYPSEFIMRHQMSCDLNPCPISSGSGFDYSQIQKSIARNLGLEMPVVRSTYDAPQSAEEVRSSMRTLSRSNSVVGDRSSAYTSRSTRASSVSRTSSFADRSYGTRSSLARQCSFSIADYSSAARRSSVFDGYAGYSIYSSISEGLDQITYGGRMSRRNSVTDLTYSYSSRRGSFSTGGGGGSGGADYPLPALMAALDASKASQEDRNSRLGGSTAAANAHVNGQAHAFLNGQYHHHSNGYSRQNSSQDSTHTIESPFGAANGYLERSDSSKGLMRRKSSIKHSSSGYKLERKVSFHNHDQIIDNSAQQKTQQQLDENGQPMDKPDKPKRKKERTEEEKAARRERKERKERKRMERAMSKERKHKDKDVEAVSASTTRNKQHPVGNDLVDQVSAKLQGYEREQDERRDREPHQWSSVTTNNQSLPTLPSTSLLPGFDQQASSCSNTISQNSSYSYSNGHSAFTTTVNGSTTTTTTASHNNPTTTNNNHQLSESADGNNPLTSVDDDVVVSMRPEESKPLKAGSKRNSLDNKSVQSLAKDLAAECAKAYELMESSLSKLTNDFSIGPFGLTPKNKKKYRAPPAPPLK